MLRAFIPSYTQIQKEQGKYYTVYQVVILDGNTRKKLERRYSAFHTLHKKLKGLHPTPHFPPKRVRNFSPVFLEQRRQGLENYIQGILDVHPIPKPVLSFLDLSHLSSNSNFNGLEEDEEEANITVTHQPILSFGKNSFTVIRKGILPDIVCQGALSGLYHNDLWLKSRLHDPQD